MSMNISGISPVPQIPKELTAPASTPQGDGTSFQNILNGAIGEVEAARGDAARSVEQFLSGDGEDLHSTILTMQRAELEFQMFMQVRNKVVSAYQEVMKMQL